MTEAVSLQLLGGTRTHLPPIPYTHLKAML